MNNKYPSFVNSPVPMPDYDCKELEVNNYQLSARCNKTNPDCEKFLQDKKSEGVEIKTIELDESLNKDNKNMIDIWIKKTA